MYKELCVARGKEFIARSKEILAEIKNACSSAKETCAFKGKRPDKKPSKKELEKAAKKNPTPNKTPEPLTPAQEFEASIFRLPPGERVPVVRVRAEEIAKERGWGDAREVRKKNPGRIIYEDKPAKTFYSVDTQHGRFEVQNKKGDHLREVDFDLKETSGPSEGHDIEV